jgi:hypothetical protein
MVIVGVSPGLPLRMLMPLGQPVSLKPLHLHLVVAPFASFRSAATDDEGTAALCGLYGTGINPPSPTLHSVAPLCDSTIANPTQLRALGCEVAMEAVD